MLPLLYTLAVLPLSIVASPLEARENDGFIQYEYREGDSKPHHCTLKAVGGAADDSGRKVRDGWSHRAPR
jgi:hypothetical protein